MSPQVQTVEPMPSGFNEAPIPVVLPKTAPEDHGPNVEKMLEGIAIPRHYGKRATDIVLSVALLVLTFPFILLCGMLVRLTSPGPALYIQTRLGRGGKPFRIFKLRTMYHECEKVSGAKWATRNDPRITKIGWFLRITHLDELPQLWNVLRGDMSLVGPRPERPEFIVLLMKQIPDYANRMTIRPGVTGLAQVYLPPDTAIGSVERKLVYDLAYLKRLGVWFDFRLMVATALNATGIPCSVVIWFLWLPYPETIEQKTDAISNLGK